jgi:PAS domain S-box-containing protein
MSQLTIDHIAPEKHPIWYLMEEHKALLEVGDRLVGVAENMKKEPSEIALKEGFTSAQDIAKQIKDSLKHYLREENVIFPYLESHGIVGPPKMMWIEHDQIRATVKRLFELLKKFSETEPKLLSKELFDIAISLRELFNIHFYKENHILFPAAMDSLSEEEWNSARKQFAEIGFCNFTPGVEKTVIEQEVVASEIAGGVEFQTGSLTPEQLEAMINTLPIELTFVDAEDKVRYYSKPKEMLFTRSNAVLGREVRLCHPQKSVHLVEKIVTEFKDGSREVAEFWANVSGKMVHIRYFAVRDKNGNYLGAVELAQDITRIKTLEGEKRLLD